MDVKIQAALIASLVTISGIYIKDYFLPGRKEAREERKQKLDVYKRYAEPLAKSAESLFWRLNEVFNQRSRAQFLAKNDVTTDFDEYKYISTLYRLGCLLGWIRAIKKEQSFIKFENDDISRRISKSLSSLENSLADGPHTEEERIRRLVELWKLPSNGEDLRDLGIQLSNKIKKELKKSDVKLICDLPASKALELNAACAEFLCERLGCPPVDESLLRETQHEVTQKLSIKEAWIYRDWQSGIGDMLLVNSDSEQRCFDVVGFKDFESMYHSDDDEMSRWISRLERTFSGVDINNDDGQDMRIGQLKATFHSVSQLILSIHESKLDSELIGEKTILEAKNNTGNT